MEGPCAKMAMLLNWFQCGITCSGVWQTITAPLIIFMCRVGLATQTTGRVYIINSINTCKCAQAIEQKKRNGSLLGRGIHPSGPNEDLSEVTNCLESVGQKWFSRIADDLRQQSPSTVRWSVTNSARATLHFAIYLANSRNHVTLFVFAYIFTTFLCVRNFTLKLVFKTFT